jgi:PEP-CTERM motif
MLPGGGIIRTGPVFIPPDERVFIDRYTGLTGPTSFGSNMLAIFADSGNGDEVGISGISHELEVPPGYASGISLSDSSTYDNATFSSLGVTPGTYVWTWGSGANQNFTLVIGTAAVPEPSSLLLLVVGLAALLLVGTGNRTRPKISN